MKKSLYSDIKKILEAAKMNAVRAVNFSMVLAYWKIGERIVKEEQAGGKKASYGNNLIEALAISLTSDYGRGFSTTNLKYFRQFYLTFQFITRCVMNLVKTQNPTHCVGNLIHYK